MHTQLSDVVLALLLAMGTEGIGELLLRRRSVTLRQCNEAFLTGLSALGIIVFPLTLIASRSTLRILTAFVLTSAAVTLIVKSIGLVRWLRGIPPRQSALSSASVVWLFVVALLVLHFAIQDLFSGYVWDGFQIWATKAMILYYSGGLTDAFLVPGEYNRLIDYPPILPLQHALLASLRGGFSWAALKANYVILFLSLLLSLFTLARQWMTRQFAFLSVALTAALPVLASHEAAGGYADMPQAAVFTGAVLAALTEGGSRAFPWLVGGTIMMKSEGSILATTLVAFVVIAAAVREGRAFGRWLVAHAGAAAIIAGSYLCRHWYLVWIQSQDVMYGPIDLRHLRRAWHLGLRVPANCLLDMLRYGEWGLLWPAFFVAAVFAWRAGRVQQVVLVGTCAIIVQYAAIFYFSNWHDVHLHIEQAYPRLLSQIAPIAVVLVVAACERELGIAPSASATSRAHTGTRLE